MALQLGALRDALIDAGASTDKAGFNLAMTATLIWRSFAPH